MKRLHNFIFYRCLNAAGISILPLLKCSRHALYYHHILMFCHAYRWPNWCIMFPQVLMTWWVSGNRYSANFKFVGRHLPMFKTVYLRTQWDQGHTTHSSLCQISLTTWRSSCPTSSLRDCSGLSSGSGTTPKLWRDSWMIWSELTLSSAWFLFISFQNQLT